MLRDFSLRDFGASLNTVESYTNESSQGKIGLCETVNKQKCTHLGMFLASEDDISIDIRAKDFDTLREIILHQNGVDYDDAFIHEDIRKWLEEQEARDNTQYSTIEDYLNAFISVTHWKPQEVKELSIRRFNGITDKFLSHDTYNLQMTASMSGLVSFKGKIDHWLTTNRKNKIYEKYFKEVN